MRVCGKQIKMYRQQKAIKTGYWIVDQSKVILNVYIFYRAGDGVPLSLNLLWSNTDNNTTNTNPNVCVCMLLISFCLHYTCKSCLTCLTMSSQNENLKGEKRRRNAAMLDRSHTYSTFAIMWFNVWLQKKRYWKQNNPKEESIMRSQCEKIRWILKLQLGTYRWRHV